MISDYAAHYQPIIEHRMQYRVKKNNEVIQMKIERKKKPI